MHHEDMPGQSTVALIANELLRLDEYTAFGEGMELAGLEEYSILKAQLAAHEDAADMAAREGKKFVGMMTGDNMLISLERDNKGVTDAIRCNLEGVNGKKALLKIEWPIAGVVAEVTHAALTRIDGSSVRSNNPERVTRDLLRAIVEPETGPVYVEPLPAKKRTARILGWLFRGNRQ
jgi:hypothetical protein